MFVPSKKKLKQNTLQRYQFFVGKNYESNQTTNRKQKLKQIWKQYLY